MPRARVFLALTLGSLLGSPALSLANPIRNTVPEFEFDLPRGFEPCAPDAPPVELLGCYRLPPAQARTLPLVLLLVRLRGAPPPPGPLTDRDRASLRRADPFPFTDGPSERLDALGFSLPVLVGRAPLQGGGAVRLSVALPLVDDRVLLAVIAPEARTSEARATLGHVLGSFRAESAWRTGPQRAFDLVARGAAFVAVALSVLHPLAVALVLRRREGYRRARAVSLGVIALAWTVFALWPLTLPGRGRWCATGQGLLLALLAIVLLVRLLRARETTPQG